MFRSVFYCHRDARPNHFSHVEMNARHHSRFSWKCWQSLRLAKCESFQLWLCVSERETDTGAACRLLRRCFLRTKSFLYVLRSAIKGHNLLPYLLYFLQYISFLSIFYPFFFFSFYCHPVLSFPKHSNWITPQIAGLLSRDVFFSVWLVLCLEQTFYFVNNGIISIDSNVMTFIL